MNFATLWILKQGFLERTKSIKFYETVFFDVYKTSPLPGLNEANSTKTVKLYRLFFFKHIPNCNYAYTHVIRNHAVI